jgi:hypothetical protein
MLGYFYSRRILSTINPGGDNYFKEAFGKFINHEDLFGMRLRSINDN